MTTLPLSEVFGPTFQGEGPASGQRCYFIRLGLCNLACSWCDTPYTWDRTRYDVAALNPATDVVDIHRNLISLGAEAGALVVLSGGEPLIHHQHLRALVGVPYRWHVETNGTIAPPSWWARRIEHTTVSPKIITNDPVGRRLRPPALAAWAEHAREGRASWKFVVSQPDDVHRAATLAATFDVPMDRVWVMPEGITPDAVLDGHRRIVQAALDAGVQTTTRLHTLLWGDERGR